MARRASSARRVATVSNASASDASSKSQKNNKPTNSTSKKPNAWAEPTPAQIERSIRDSVLPVVISLEIPVASTETNPPRLALLECGLSSWQELVELQRILDSLERPTRATRDTKEAGSNQEEDVLEGMVFGSTAKPELQLSPGAVNSVYRVATTLVLRLQSLGLSVRSLLKDRVLVRLPVDSAAVNTRKHVAWDAMVVAPATTDRDDVPAWIQRVELPPLRVVEDPLSQLRHPRLVPMVDRMLEEHAQSGHVHVVILRGIPGSGKSSLGREVVAICKARGVRSVVCSADSYFETSRGYQFDVKAISKAHEASQKLFRETLEEKKAAVVVVDNTHTQNWEYETYEKTALAHSSHVHLLEMHCPDVLTCNRMAQRNSHGVSVLKVMAMYLRWEADARATLFPAQFQDPLVLENPVTRNPMNNYVAYVGLFLDEATRANVLERVGRRHANVFAEHITLFYRPTTQYIRQAPIGKTFTVRITSIVEDSKGQALQVELDDRLPLKCMNKIPHITVSTTQGVSAFYSNELLENTSATRTRVGDVWEIEVTVGIALMAQNRKIVSLTSPFQHQFAIASTTGEEVPPSSFTAPRCDSVVVLDVDAADLLSASTSSETLPHTLLRHELVRHSAGPHATSQRIVAVRNTPNTTDLDTETTLIAAVRAQLSPSWKSSELGFDSVVFLKAGETLASKILPKIAVVATRLTVLTTQPSSLVAQELSKVNACRTTVKQLPRFGGDIQNDPLGRLAPDLDARLTYALDAMGVGTSEEACFTVQMAVRVAESALATCGVHGAVVERVDSTLWSHPSSIVEIATLAPTTECSVDALVAAIQSCGVHSVTVLTPAEDGDVLLQFQLPTSGTQTPAIRWHVAHSPDSLMRVSDRIHRVTAVRRRLRDSLSADAQEAFPRVASLVGALLRRNSVAPDASPASDLQLLSERVTLAFLESSASTDAIPSDAKPTDYRVLWARIVACLEWLASWSSEQWALELRTVSTHAEPTAADEMAKRLCAVMTAASEAAIAAGSHDVKEKTGVGSWGRKLYAILSAPIAQAK